jgi:hypothetical protein
VHLSHVSASARDSWGRHPGLFEGVDRIMLRPRLETVLSAILAVMTAITLVWPAWIEALTGRDPDGGSGMVEWIIVAVLALLALASALLARRDYRLAMRRSRAVGPAA